MRLSYDWPCRICRLTFTVLMVIAWSGGVGSAMAQDTPATPPIAQPADGAELEKAAAVIERLVRIAQEELRGAAADPSDVRAKAASLGHDAQQIFAFVRDEVSYEPYAGVLRGARGALSARAANSIDKALLLSEMLQAGGHPARIVTGSLDRDDAQALVRQFLAGDPLTGPLGELLESSNSPEALADFAQRSGLDAQKIGALAGDVEEQFRETEQTAEQQTSAATTHLLDQLQANNIAIGQTSAQWLDELTNRAVRHAWVQVQNADGTWTDLDPSFADSEYGKTRGADAAPIEGELPDRHRVNIKLLYAHGAEGDVTEEEILTVPLDTGDALFRPADFSIRPADELPSPDKLLAMTPEQRIKLLTSIEKYQAVVRSGARGYASRVFDLKGNLYDVSPDGRVRGASQLGGAVGGMFGGALGGGDEEKPDDSGTFRSLAVVISFDVPEGQAPIPPQRRVLLTADDLKGEHVVSPLVDWEILIQPQVISATLAASGTLRHLMAVLEPTLAEMRAGDGGSLGRVMASAPEPYPQFLTQWSMFRQAALARSLKQTPAGLVLWDAPQVVVAERRFCMNKANGHMCDRSRIDIVHNGLSIVPRDQASEAAAAGLALRQGVFDTVAEAILLEQAVPDGMATSAIAELDSARAEGKAFGVYAADSLSGAPLETSDQAFIQTSESNRRVLVPAVNAGATASAWWSIDPRTGSVVGRTSGGYGEALVENAMLQQIAGGLVCFMAAFKDAMGSGKDAKSQRVNLFQFLACTIGMGTGVLGVVGGAGPKALGIIFYVNLAITGSIVLYK